VGVSAWVPHLDVCALCAPASFQRPPCLLCCPSWACARRVCGFVRPSSCVFVFFAATISRHMSLPGLRPRAAASAVPPVAPPAGSPVDPAAARLSSLSPAAAPFSPASTAFPQR